MAENSIQIIIEGIDKASPEFAKAQAALGKLSGAMAHGSKATDTLSKQTAALAEKTISVRNALQPLAQGVSVVTNRVAQLSPELGIAVSQLDNIAFSMIRAAGHGAGFAGALRAAFNPVTLVVLGLATATSVVVDKMLAASDAKRKLDEAFRTGNVAAFRDRLKEVETELETLEGKLNTISPLASGANFVPPAEMAKLTQQFKELNAMLQERADLLAKIKQIQAEQFRENLPQLEAQLATGNQIATLQLKAAEAERAGLRTDALNIAARIRVLEIEKQLNDMRAKGAQETDLAYVKQLLQQNAALGNQRAVIELKEREAKFLSQFIGDQGEINDLTEDQVSMTNEVLRNIQAADEAQRRATQAMFSRLLQQDLGENDMLEIGDPDAIKRTEEIARENTARMQAVLDSAAGNMARSFLDNFINVITAAQSGDILGAIQSFGASIGRSLIEAMLKEIIAAQVPAELLKSSSGSIGGLLLAALKGFGGLFSGLFSGGWDPGWSDPGGPFSGFAHGGMVIPNGAVKAFASGGIVRNGPVVGMVGEEGPELVARMKPAGTSKEEEGIKQSIFIVDQRPKGLGPNDVVMVVSGDMERGGRTSKAMHHVLKRGK